MYVGMKKIEGELKSTIEWYEKQLLDKDVRKSAEKTGELLVDEFYEFPPSGGMYTKSEVLKLLPLAPENNFLVFDFEVYEIAPDTVLATYLDEREVVETGEKSNAWHSSIWQKRGDKWLLLFHQGTPTARRTF
jgi:hypothetical protein